MAHGFGDARLQHISNIIREGMTTEGQTLITKHVESATTQMQEKMGEMMVKLDSHHANKTTELDATTEHVMKAIENQQNQICEIIKIADAKYQAMADQLIEQENVKRRIIEELSSRQAEMEVFKSGMVSSSAETQRIVNRATGGWKENVERNIVEAQSHFEYKIA